MKKLEQINSRKLNLMHRSRSRVFGMSPHMVKQKRLGIFGHEIIEAPRDLDLIQGSNSECDDYFNKIRTALKGNPKCIYLSFRETKVLKAMPMLVLYSILDIAREENQVQTKINIIWSKKSAKVNLVLKSSGEFKPAADREAKIEECPKSLPVIMGDNARVDELSNNIIDYILDNHFQDASAEKEQQIASAINETVENVGRHAYPNIDEHELKKWWFCCNRIGDNLYLVIYDAGIGIPSSLSENNGVMLSRINALYPDQYKGSISDSINDKSASSKMKAIVKVKFLRKTLSDGQLIRAAMHTDVTSTDLAKHGQGSKSIKGLITDDENSFLLMFSNYGFYCYSRDREENENSVQNTEHKIPGTLIQWSI